MTEMRVRPSSVERQPFADFVVILNDDTIRRLDARPGGCAILESAIASKAGESRTLRIEAVIVSEDDENVDTESVGKIQCDEICMDQTCREALFVDVGDAVRVSIPHERRRMAAKDRLLNRMNFQKSVLRVHPNSTYMERKIPVVCVCEEMINSVGARYGDRVIIESAGASDRSEATAVCAPLTPAMQRFHDRVTAMSRTAAGVGSAGDREAAGAGAPVPDGKLDLIHPVFVDAIARRSLGGVPQLYPVKMRRSFVWDLLKKINGFGPVSLIAFSVSTIGLTSSPDSLLYWILTVLFGGWAAWSIMTSSTYGS